MKKLGEAGYILNEHELICLVALTGAQSLMGVTGYIEITSKKQASEFYNGVIESLELKQYANEELSGDITLDRVLMDSIKICGSPGLFFACMSSEEESRYSCSYYIRDGEAVKIERDLKIDNTYILTPFKSLTRLQYSLEEFFDLGEFSDAKEIENSSNQKVKLTFTRESFQQFIYTVEAGSEFSLYELQKASGINLEQCRDLYHAFNKKNHMRTIVLLDSTDDIGSRPEMRDDLFVYGGDKHIWRMTLGNSREAAVTIESVSYEDFLRETGRLLNIVGAGNAENKEGD